MILEMLALGLWGTVVGIDLISVGQFMVARPLVAGTVAGVIVGDPATGVTIGILLELFALDTLPVGATAYPDYGPGTVAGVAAAAGAPGLLGLGVGVTVALIVAYVGEWTIALTRRMNTADAHHYHEALDGGDPGVIRSVHHAGLVRDRLRAVGLTAFGLLVAAAVRRWATLDVQTAVILVAVLVGVAVGTAGLGALRLTDRPRSGVWLVAGIAGGLGWVILR